MSGDEINKTKRPNANYQLSKPDTGTDDNGGLVFYYNRERRLEKSPELKKLYTEEKKSKFGLIGVLIADRPRRFLFIVIILLCVAILVLSLFGYLDTSYKIDGNKIEVTAAIFENSTIIILNKIAGNAKSYAGSVDIAISPVLKSPNDELKIFTHRIFFTLEKEESYRFAVPFDSEELLMVLQSEISELKMSFKPK
ncbi:MAG: hypothetical protein FWB73_00675 [Treponema sp.]|nr:hypothetical protein [Treponema sp.]